MNPKLLPLLVVTLATSLCSLSAQQGEPDGGTSEEKSPLKIQSVQVEAGVLPNSKREWTKIICSFDSPLEWVDGLSFNFIALVSTGGSSFRVVTGGETYMNVPKGKSQAIMYMSPNSTERFGKPKAVQVDIYRGDLPIGSFNWTDGQVSPASDWTSKYSAYEGQLQPMRFTPWIVFDSDKTPDVSGY